MKRLVTVEDIQANPELSKKGISVNQEHDFGDEDFYDLEPFTIKSRGEAETTTAASDLPSWETKEVTKELPKKQVAKTVVTRTHTQVSKEVTPKKAEIKALPKVKWGKSKK